MSQEASPLKALSSELAATVARSAPSIVRVDDGSRLTATGTIWSEDGLIVTTSHGTERDEDLFVETHDGTRHGAALIGRDNDSDLALLRVNAASLPALAPAADADVQIGNLVLALGRPGTSGLQATLGIISARIEAQTNGNAEYILHTDAVLYPGFSGGPLVTVDGQMAGLANRLFGRGSGIALGIPVIAQVVETLLKHGRIPRGYLGIRTQLVSLPEAIQATLGTEQDRGLLIVQVEPGSPAEQAGLLLGDTLVGINDTTLTDVDHLRRHLRVGQSVTLTTVRGGERREVTVTIAAGE